MTGNGLRSGLDLCGNCGHPRERHWAVAFGVPGGKCMATVDKRPLAAGGDTLTPCDCKGFAEWNATANDLLQQASSSEPLSDVATLGKWAEEHLRALFVWAGEQGDNAFAGQVRQWSAERLSDLDAFGAQHRQEHP